MFKKASLIIIALFSVSACADRPKPLGKPMPDLSFNHLQPISFGGPVHVKRSFTPGRLDAGNKLVIPLTDLLYRYAGHRFAQDNFAPSVAILDIERAGVSHSIEEGSLAGMVGGADTFLADIVISLTPQESSQLKKAYTISLKQTVRIPHALSLAEKEAAQMKFLEGIIEEIDKQVQLITDREAI